MEYSQFCPEEIEQNQEDEEFKDESLFYMNKINRLFAGKSPELVDNVFFGWDVQRQIEVDIFVESQHRFYLAFTGFNMRQNKWELKLIKQVGANKFAVVHQADVAPMSNTTCVDRTLFYFKNARSGVILVQYGLEDSVPVELQTCHGF